MEVLLPFLGVLLLMELHAKTFYYPGHHRCPMLFPRPTKKNESKRAQLPNEIESKRAQLPDTLGMRATLKKGAIPL
jgi:hypothetical protein